VDPLPGPRAGRSASSGWVWAGGAGSCASHSKTCSPSSFDETVGSSSISRSCAPSQRRSSPVERRNARDRRETKSALPPSPRRINRSRARIARSRTPSRLANGPCGEDTDLCGPLEWVRDECGAYHSLVCRLEDVRSGCAPTRTAWSCRGPGRSATPLRRTPRHPARRRPLAGSSRARPGASRGSRGGTG
jgi:hypothetical protein